ncbi:hypothetical protein ACWQG8_001823 [Klebsiella pneumoniae]|nr:hypothetical protein [Klebsiella pneumoniae]
MVDKDSFLNKLNQRAQDEKLAQEKAKIEKQNLHAEANKKIEIYISGINALISDITDWISGSSIELITKQKEISEKIVIKLVDWNIKLTSFFLSTKG